MQHANADALSRRLYVQFEPMGYGDQARGTTTATEEAGIIRI